MGGTRAEKVGAFGGIVAIAFGVDDVVDAIEEEAQRKNDIKKAEPKRSGAKIERTTEWHQVKEDGGSPEARARNLNEKFGGAKKSVFGERLGGSLGGYAHRRE